MATEDPEGESTASVNGPLSALLNPVVIIAMMILLSIFVLIGAAILGMDKGVLAGMGRIDFARGLITYLFAVVTIGTAVVLVVSALTGTETKAHQKRFQRGKEILALLLGVFGTIVGFYFGSEVGQKTNAQQTPLLVAPIHLTAETVSSGGQISLETYVSGGNPPFKYGIAFDANQMQTNETVPSNGWIEKTVTAPQATAEEAIEVHLAVVDSTANKAEVTAPVVVKPHQ